MAPQSDYHAYARIRPRTPVAVGNKNKHNKNGTPKSPARKRGTHHGIIIENKSCSRFSPTITPTHSTHSITLKHTQHIHNNTHNTVMPLPPVMIATLQSTIMCISSCLVAQTIKAYRGEVRGITQPQSRPG